MNCEGTRDEGGQGGIDISCATNATCAALTNQLLLPLLSENKHFLTEMVDEWGMTEMRLDGIFSLVTVRVSSQAKAISQRVLDVEVSLLDATNHRFAPSEAGQQAFDAIGKGGLPLSSKLAPGESFLRTIVFDVPLGVSHLGLVVAHGQFPDLFVIGSEQSLFYKPTLMLLQPGN